jgi:glycosyltransferase involved in cell wall biosynthesis
MKKRKKAKAKQRNIRSKSDGEFLKRRSEAAPHSHDLKKVLTDRQQEATISVCMIVKNEEKLLPRCLKSIQNLTDEIILVDTGSEDRTVEIAERFGCKIYNYPWRGDFSSARNESLKYAAKDEELPAGEIDKIKYFVRQPSINIISMSVFNKSLETGEISSFLPSIRLFRRKLGFKYEGIVHNRLVILPGSAVARCNIRLNHYGYDLSRDELEKKLARSRVLLEKQIRDNPDDVYANFNMVQLLRGIKEAHSPETNRLILEHAGRVGKILRAIHNGSPSNCHGSFQLERV